jgi:hypothetical protein
MIPPSLLVISQGWGLIDLPLRASNEGSLRSRVARAQKIIRLHPLLCSKHLLRGMAKAALYCAHSFFDARGARHAGRARRAKRGGLDGVPLRVSIPVLISIPVQYTAKQGREELLTAAVERGPS